MAYHSNINCPGFGPWGTHLLPPPPPHPHLPSKSSTPQNILACPSSFLKHHLAETFVWLNGECSRQTNRNTTSHFGTQTREMECWFSGIRVGQFSLSPPHLIPLLRPPNPYFCSFSLFSRDEPACRLFWSGILVPIGFRKFKISPGESKGVLWIKVKRKIAFYNVKCWNRTLHIY